MKRKTRQQNKGLKGNGTKRVKGAAPRSASPEQKKSIPFGSEDGGFNPLSKHYKENPTAENYLKLRREYPGGEVEVAVTGGIDQLFFLAKELEKFGIDPGLVAAAMDADEKAIADLSLLVLERLVERKRKSRAGGTHLSSTGKAIPDKLVDWLISCALDSLSWNDCLVIPRELIVLIRERLGGSGGEYAKASQAHQMRRQAIVTGGQLMARGETPTYRLIAKILEVAPSTVKRWFPNGEFLREIKKVVDWFDRDGKPKTGLANGRALRTK